MSALSNHITASVQWVVNLLYPRTQRRNRTTKRYFGILVAMGACCMLFLLYLTSVWTSPHGQYLDQKLNDSAKKVEEQTTMSAPSVYNTISVERVAALPTHTDTDQFNDLVEEAQEETTMSTLSVHNTTSVENWTVSLSTGRYVDHNRRYSVDKAQEERTMSTVSIHTTSVERRVTLPGYTKEAKRGRAPEIRAERLQKTCEKLSQSDPTPYTATAFRQGGRYIVDKRHQMIYCPIEKVGSSFWKRVFAILRSRRTGPQWRVFNISGVGIHRRARLDTINYRLLHRRLDFFDSFSKFLFVRDPYERLFSGFIDKLFTPTFETDSMSRAVARAAHLPIRPSGYPQRGMSKLSVPSAVNSSPTPVSEMSSPKEDVTAQSVSSGTTPELHRNASRLDSEKAHSHLKFKLLHVIDYDADVDDKSREQTSDDYVPRTKSKTRESVGHDDHRRNHYDDYYSRRRRKPIHNAPYDEIEPDLNDRTLSVRKHPRFDSEDNEYQDFLRKQNERHRDRRTSAHRISRKRTLCPVKVTFEEFVRHVIRDVFVNEHFRPMSSRCPPCFLPYDFVGKLETFKDDVNSILRAAQVNPERVASSSSTFDRDSDMNIMRDIALRTFSVLRKYRGCMTTEEMLRRTWLTFQIRGFLSINQSFPLSEVDLSTISPDNFLRIVKHAYARSGPRELRMRQRKTAMLEAFYSLPRKLLKMLESHVDKDCQLFDYECSVESRFDPKNEPQPVFHFNQLVQEFGEVREE